MSASSRLRVAESAVKAKKTKGNNHPYMSEEEITFIRGLNRGLDLFVKTDKTAAETVEMQEIELQLGTTMAEANAISEAFLNDY
jgi:hypothetical protein